MRAPVRRAFPGLGARILAFRGANEVSQAVLAVRLGIGQPRLREAEQRDLATLDTLARLAPVLGVPLDVLTGRKGAKS